MNSCFLRDLLCSLCLVLFVAPSVVAQNPTTPTAKTPSETEISDLAIGKVRQALATQRALIASHPEDPSNYIDLAYTLTDAGITDQASQEVRKATAVAPRSVLAYRAQGWVLHHNVIGVEYGKGFDYDGSMASYRKAIELDPGDLDAWQSLTELLEYNRNGIRYAPDAQLAEAIEILRYVKGHQSAVKPEVRRRSHHRSFLRRPLWRGDP
jgi:tetratricopeptide (TPR) repeat protein